MEVIKKIRIIKDQVYDMVEIPEYLIKFINSMPFQRLIDIKQLGVVHFVFPGGTHSRKAHAIGVATLANRMMLDIKSRYPELLVTDKEIELVTIAGLLHDIGHGPFSHLFEIVMKQYIPDYNHEKVGCSIIRKYFSKFFEDERDLEFVIDVINGVHTLSEKRKFLYQIVNNNSTGIDVDKFDYYRRDSYNTKVRITCNVDFLSKIFIIYQGEIFYRDIYYDHVFNFFKTRNELHTTVYNHKAVWQIELMIIDIFKFLFETKRISVEDILDLDKFICMDDSIIKLASDSIPYKRLYTRDLYSTIFELRASSEEYVNEIETKISDFFNDREDKNLYTIIKKQVGKPEKDHPLTTMNFLKRDNDTDKLKVCVVRHDKHPFDMCAFILRVITAINREKCKETKKLLLNYLDIND